MSKTGLLNRHARRVGRTSCTTNSTDIPDRYRRCGLRSTTQFRTQNSKTFQSSLDFLNFP
jgi:hypothetical protein